MTTAQGLIDAVTALGGTIRAEKADLKIRPAGILPAELKERLRAHKPELLAHLTAPAPDTGDLSTGMKRPEAARLSVAIQEDGTARIVHTTEQLIDGETRYTRQEMLMYVTLTQRERRLLHSFKRTFDGEAKVKP